VSDRAAYPQLWEQVHANGRKLNACPIHAFELIGAPDQSPFGRRYRCSRCGGEADSLARHWYELGLRHAGNA
jgi:hypothetical protein